ncbi:MAG: bifunctional 4-hydroxy-2-oxoglutarate aldolase/2-dehydro-3-deoxy-phosphogluconate aldolase [Oscillospiraceae bacterium]|nr:bifunctional 4-hydroxy-2-oxoglutarate aldolase/2-dehydro-3-deoxy-phosphogluconate aldolase [Oscillospiraceae bacterium]
MREAIIERVEATKIIAILRGVSDRDICLKLASAIRKGGIELIEVTFNQSAPERFSDTTNAISAIAREFGEDICVGAGTVLTPELVQMAAEAGAKYIVSPDVSIPVIQKTRELELVSIPGALTPSEITTAISVGADIIKLFPAGSMGSGYIKSIKAPLSHIKFVATGGIDAGNIPEFLAAGCVGFGIGGNLVNVQWAAEGRYDQITQAAQEIYRAANG